MCVCMCVFVYSVEGARGKVSDLHHQLLSAAVKAKNISAIPDTLTYVIRCKKWAKS